MCANRHGGSRKAARPRELHPQKKATLHWKPRENLRQGLKRRNHQRHRCFLRHSALAVLHTMAQEIRKARPPTHPRDVARFLFLKTLQGWSYDETYAMLEALPDLTQIMEIQKLPAASTVAALVPRIRIAWIERVLQQTAQRLSQGHRVNAAGDSTGEATHQYDRWFDLRHGKASLRRRFLKLHALIATRADRPYFLSARVTRGTGGDSPQLLHLLNQVDPSIELGNVALDAAYPSRRNTTLIEERGGMPVIALKSNTKVTRALGHPAWGRMLRRQWGDRQAHRCQYRRRGVIEGMFGGFKARFGSRVLARRRHAQRVEILLRVVLWNVLAIVYHGA